MRFHVTRKQRLVATIAISGGFFVAELVVGFRTKSLALIADAFHYLSDRKPSPETLTFGWRRAQVLGAFFNGVFLLALGVSIFLQAVERFVNLTCEYPCSRVTEQTTYVESSRRRTRQNDGESIEEPLGTGGTSSVNSKQATSDSKEEDIKHGHRGRDLGMLGVMIHVIGDAINNVGVIVAAVVIWKGEGNGRFYADPGVSLFIALTIMGSAWPLCKRAGHILLESASPDLSLDDVRAEITKVSGVESVADLLVWRIDQRTMLATAHVIVTDDSVNNFNSKATAIGAGLRPYGIQSIALQPIRQRPATPAV
ncbi:Zinc homeostasis factor 1, partial [Colletotrichum shisoi]